MASCRQAKNITWPNVDPDFIHRMASLGYYELRVQTSGVMGWGHHMMSSGLKVLRDFLSTGMGFEQIYGYFNLS